MKVVVTGGAGFIGSHLVEALVQQGLAVTVLDNLSTGSLQNLSPIRSQIDWVEGDVRDTDAVSAVMHGVQWVFHLAALTSVSQSLAQPDLTERINIEGSRNVLDAAAQAGVKRVVLSSTCAVYGDVEAPAVKESMTPSPKSPYAVSKLAMEEMARRYTQESGLETICLRYFNVYGPRQNAQSDYASVIPRFLERYRQRTAPVVYGTGEQSRDFIHVSDIVRANLLAAQAPVCGTHTLNIGTGNSVTLLDLLEALSQTFGYRLEPQFEPARPGEILHSRADVTLAQQILSYRSQVDLFEGLKTMLSVPVTG